MLKNLDKVIIKLTVKNLLILLFLIIGGVYYYLYETNYWFDKRLEKMANPLLQEIIEKGNYRIGKSKICPFEAVQICLDVDDLMAQLVNQKGIIMTKILLYDFPSTALRMNGNPKNDRKFHNKEYIPCDTDRRYAGYVQLNQNLEKLGNGVKNFKYYSLYRKDDGLGHNIFIDNLEKYKNNLIGLHIKDDMVPVENGVAWIINYNGYYYIFLETNGKEAGHNLNQLQERQLVFKKFTKNELMHYDNGSYWKLIRDYNIKID